MAWVFLTLAVLLDVAGTVCLKLSHGLTRLAPAIATFLFYGVGFAPLALAVRDLPVGMVYAIWSAVGTILVFAVGVLWFKEPASAMKLGSIALIVIGLVMFNLSTRPT